jgi:cytochrome c oxidase subunit 2
MIPPALRRSALVLAPIAAFAALLALAPGAFAGVLTPESGGSPNADSISDLYKIVLVLATLILALVEGVLIWSLVKFRARKGAQAAQIHGNTNLEIGWTVGAAVILVILAIVTFIFLSKINNPPNTAANGFQGSQTLLSASNTGIPKPPNGKALRICITGRQYIWRFTYSTCADAGLGKVYSYRDLYVPADTTVVVDIQSTDVNHSWWIPKLGGKFDAVPGYHNYTWFKARHPGQIYPGRCAELCGRNHADMTASVHVLTPTQFESWLSQQKQGISDANKLVQKQRKTIDAGGDL